MILLDTNVLLRFVELKHPQHQEAFDAIAVLRHLAETVSIVPQNLYEFWVVATRAQAHNGLELTPAETDGHLSHFQTVFQLLDDPPALLVEWRRLVLQTSTTGKKAHDTRLVAAMNVHKITRLLTFNPNDFHRFAGITVLAPADVLSSRAPPSP
jgi:predicted nucleic acid-binding protein